MGEGAIELIELAGAKLPMIENGPAHRMGNTLDSLKGFFGKIVGDGIAKVANLLADILQVPTDLINIGVDFVLLNLASIVSEIPIIGEFIATILVAVNSLIKLAVSLPELVLRQIATLASGMKTLTPEQQAKAFMGAMNLINQSAPPDIAPSVQETVKTAPKAYGVNVDETSAVDWLVGAAAAAAPFALLAA